MNSTPNQHDILQISHLFLYTFGQLSNYSRCSLQPDEDDGAIPSVWVRTYVREVTQIRLSTMLRLVSRTASGLFYGFVVWENRGIIEIQL